MNNLDDQEDKSLSNVITQSEEDIDREETINYESDSSDNVIVVSSSCPSQLTTPEDTVTSSIKTTQSTTNSSLLRIFPYVYMVLPMKEWEKRIQDSSGHAKAEICFEQ